MAVRAPKPLQDAAKAALADHHWGIREFFVACMNGVTADPDAFLEHLEPHRPEPPKRGRPWPPKEEADEGTSPPTDR